VNSLIVAIVAVAFMFTVAVAGVAFAAEVIRFIRTMEALL
jgi:hypothetical protein